MKTMLGYLKNYNSKTNTGIISVGDNDFSFKGSDFISYYNLNDFPYISSFKYDKSYIQNINLNLDLDINNFIGKNFYIELSGQSVKSVRLANLNNYMIKDNKANLPYLDKKKIRNWLIRAALIIIIWWLVFTESGARILSNILPFQFTTLSPATASCEELGELIKDGGLKNVFGASNKILKISDVSLVSRNSDKLVCSAKFVTEFGIENFKMSLEKVGDELMYLAEPDYN